MRNESNEVVHSVEASIRAAKASGCRLNISHHKICGHENWGKSVQTLRLVDRAADEGVRVTLDAYPYTAPMTNLNVCLPQWSFANGPEKMRQLLQDPAVRKGLIKTEYDADLVLFDYDALRDRADYHSCFETAEGIKKVFVGG